MSSLADEGRQPERESRSETPVPGNAVELAFPTLLQDNSYVTELDTAVNQHESLVSCLLYQNSINMSLGNITDINYSEGNWNKGWSFSSHNELDDVS